MPTIADLQARLKSIPGKRDRKNLVGKLRQYRDLSASAAPCLYESLQSLSMSTQIFPDVNTNAVVTNSAAARKAAEKIYAKLQSDPANIETNSVAEKFIELRDKTENVQRNVKDNWKRSIETKVNSFRGVIRAASDAGVRGASMLQSTVNELLSEADRLPSNNTDVARVTAECAQLENAVSSLNLTGKGGKFLVAAAEGTADARDLLDKDVIAFIEEYDLWSALTVRLG